METLGLRVVGSSEMRLTRCELLRLRIPFRGSFDHAGARRAASDTLMARLSDEAGHEGLGEIQARPYVTGESADEIIGKTGPELAGRLLGLGVASQDELIERVDLELSRCGRDLALWGGFEGALRQLWAQREPLDETRWIGPRRGSSTTTCVTIGLEDDPKVLRKNAMAARLRGSGVVKVKVGTPGDRERLERLDGFFKGKMPLRLDANGVLELGRGVELLRECADLPIHSLEQPFAADDPDLGAKLRELRAATGIALMADESICAYEEAERLAAAGDFQIWNLRVGKMGGLRGVARIAALAERAGVGVVSGTMVGESGVLDHASERLLAHCEALEYVEGLGQNTFLLTDDPVHRVGDGPDPIFRLRSDLPEPWYVAHEIFE